MSRALQSFEYGIKDAEELLAHFDAINTNPPAGQCGGFEACWPSDGAHGMGNVCRRSASGGNEQETGRDCRQLCR